MKKIISILDRLNKWSGKAVGWLSTALVVLICIDVAMRYLFDFTLIWIIELEIYLFALLFLLSAGYALQKEKHVRVDVFYASKSKRSQAWINLVGTLVFLIPWCMIIIWVSYNYAYMSFLISEKSAQPGGLPALYLLKFSITLGFVLLLLQGIGVILKSIQTIKSEE
ncbi:MAG: TRAP transporter small permease subunit [Saprospiraceae bacterium]|nr:TRAP transporter small permease subunit [Saprospiraceae bacterium]